MTGNGAKKQKVQTIILIYNVKTKAIYHKFNCLHVRCSCIVAILGHFRKTWHLQIYFIYHKKKYYGTYNIQQNI